MTISQGSYAREDSHAVRKMFLVLLAAVLAALALIFGFAPSARAALSAVGPVNTAPGTPGFNFPFWYQDADGLRLDLCLDGPPNCLAAADELVAPDGEAFWFDAGADMNTNAGGGVQTKALLTLAIEAAFTPAPDGLESSFDRVRIRANVPHAGTYVVTHPYGAKSFTVEAEDVGAGFEINDTVDFGCDAPVPDNTCNDGIPADFDRTTAGVIGPFLTWDTFGLPEAQGGPPLGFIGDAATPHAVTGSPTGNNFFRITGPDIGGAGDNGVQTNLFTVQGKISGPFATATPKGRIFNNSLSLFLLANDTTTKVHFTTNGTTPTAASPFVTSSGNVLINATTTLKFIAIDAAGNKSQVFTEKYTKNTPPVISAPRPVPGSSTSDRTPLIGATVRDAQSNLVEGNIKLFVDGRAISPTRFSYSPATDRLSYLSGRLGFGGHTVRVTATDPQGLSGTKSWSFRVTR